MLATSLHSNTVQKKLVEFNIVWDAKTLTWRKFKMQEEAGFPSGMVEIFSKSIYFHFPDYRNFCIRRRENSSSNNILTFL
jgi:hypothetical protein